MLLVDNQWQSVFVTQFIGGEIFISLNLESQYHTLKYQPKSVGQTFGNFRKWDAELMSVFLISCQMLLWVNTEQLMTKAAMMLPLLLQLLLGTTGNEISHSECVGVSQLEKGNGWSLNPVLSSKNKNSGLAIRCYSDHSGPNSAGGIETCDEGGVCSSSRIIFR